MTASDKVDRADILLGRYRLAGRLVDVCNRASDLELITAARMIHARGHYPGAHTVWSRNWQLPTDVETEVTVALFERLTVVDRLNIHNALVEFPYGDQLVPVTSLKNTCLNALRGYLVSAISPHDRAWLLADWRSLTPLFAGWPAMTMAAAAELAGTWDGSTVALLHAAASLDRPGR